LNSNLFHAFAKKVFVEKQGDWFEVQPANLESFPIPVVPTQKQKPVERLVERILSAKQRDVGLRSGASSPQASADVRELACLDEAIAKAEAELDELVYALYALTPEEIKLVQAAAK
jgi:adenine-specific DNA-methyltransferase